MMRFLRKIYYFIPFELRNLIRLIFAIPNDIKYIFARKKNLVPPKRLRNIGKGDFLEIGNKFFNHIIENTKINPKTKVLEIGCGCGRISAPFTKFLEKPGRYTGFDILPSPIKWCKKNYSEYEIFEFDYYPIKNDLYNPYGKISAAEFKFPYPENTFDLIISISVFTHMQKNETENYFSQIPKLLKTSGILYASFFILSNKQKSDFFPYDNGDILLHNKIVPSANVAYRLDYIEKLAVINGLKISKIEEGWWKFGKKIENFIDFQDILIFEKQ
ncbi:MAG: class I SAM-dependent methyltransferase [Bacteroidales bacterium]